MIHDPNLIMYTMVSEGEFAFDRDNRLMWRPGTSSAKGLTCLTQWMAKETENE